MVCHPAAFPLLGSRRLAALPLPSPAQYLPTGMPLVVYLPVMLLSSGAICLAGQCRGQSCALAEMRLV